MKDQRAIEAFQRKILLEAIQVVEENDYTGLLISKGKAITASVGSTFNNETPLEVFDELCNVIDEMLKYRKLNTLLALTEAPHSRYLQYDSYFKSRIRSARIVQGKLRSFLTEQL